MAFFQAMQLVGVGLQFASAMDASRAARDQAAFNVYQQKLQLAQNKIQAREKANIRLSQYETAQASNRALFSFLNRDIGSDRSLKAFFDKQAETVGKIYQQYSLKQKWSKIRFVLKLLRLSLRVE